MCIQSNLRYKHIVDNEVNKPLILVIKVFCLTDRSVYLADSSVYMVDKSLYLATTSLYLPVRSEFLVTTSSIVPLAHESETELKLDRLVKFFFLQLLVQRILLEKSKPLLLLPSI